MTDSDLLRLEIERRITELDTANHRLSEERDRLRELVGLLRSDIEALNTRIRHLETVNGRLEAHLNAGGAL